MRSAKTILLILALMLCLGVVAAHAQDNAPGKGLTIGFAQTGSESGWRTAFTDKMLAEAKAEGVNLLFSDGQQKQENQIAAMRAWIAQGVDAIIVAPLVETGWDDVLKEAKDANIPVLVIDRSVTADPSLYITRVATDFDHEGRLAAAWLASATSSRDSCNIVELQGTVGSSAAIDRMAGFNKVLELFPNMKIIASQSGNFTRTEGKTVMEGFLKSIDPTTICAVWAHNDDMLMGAIQAMKEAGLKPGKDILTISVDGIPDIFKAMADGEANATVELSADMGRQAFQAIRDHLDGKTLPAWIQIPGGMFFPDTAAAEYAKRTAAS